MSHIATVLLLHAIIIVNANNLPEAAKCSQSRTEEYPTGKQIADILTKGTLLSEFCAGNFSPQSNTDNTYNYWYSYDHDSNYVSN